jgi:spore maturation protein CgeB
MDVPVVARAGDAMPVDGRPLRIVLFCHSLVSDWNHGNAHFLRGVASELLARGHDVRVFEPRDAWSRVNLIADAGQAAVAAFHAAYPRLSSIQYDPATLDLDDALDGADLVLVHEWNDHPLVARIGRHRARGGRYVLLFHDTHHRSVTAAEVMTGYDLEHYDGVLAFGDVIRQRYLAQGWARRAWTWHEAADVRVFQPTPAEQPEGDVVWIGNWGDGERTAELHRHLIDPIRHLGLRARVYGVRYPEEGRAALAGAGIDYAGWLPNHRAPEVYGRFRATVHVPRRPYVDALPGIPTIRVFEALACGIPLVSAWWDDAEGLFRAGEDYLVVRDPREMARALRAVTSDGALAEHLARAGLDTIRARHTCAHRVTELLAIAAAIAGRTAERAVPA